jgi:hypothetical protein
MLRFLSVYDKSQRLLPALIGKMEHELQLLTLCRLPTLEDHALIDETETNSRRMKNLLKVSLEDTENSVQSVVSECLNETRISLKLTARRVVAHWIGLVCLRTGGCTQAIIEELTEDGSIVVGVQIEREFYVVARLFGDMTLTFGMYGVRQPVSVDTLAQVSATQTKIMSQPRRRMPSRMSKFSRNDLLTKIYESVTTLVNNQS